MGDEMRPGRPDDARSRFARAAEKVRTLPTGEARDVMRRRIAEAAPAIAAGADRALRRAASVGNRAAASVAGAARSAGSGLAEGAARLGVGRRLFGVLQNRRAQTLLPLALVLIALAGSLLPPAMALASAVGDYQRLRALGESGLGHLLAAKADLERMAGSNSGLGSGLGDLLNPPPQASAPYTLLVQRQAGTFYPVNITVHPSPRMAKQGVAQAQWSQVIGTDTTWTLGAPRATATATATAGPATPPRATPRATPSATPRAGASPTPAVNAGPDLDPALLRAAQDELRAAQDDFQNLRGRLNTPDWLLETAAQFRGTDRTLATVAALAEIGGDIAAMGLDVSGAVLPLLTRLRTGPLLADQALLTQADIDALQQTLTRTGKRLETLAARLTSLDMSALPLSAAQKASFTKLVDQLPQIQSLVRQVTPLVPAVGWLLGVGQARNFLVQTLDRSELRPSGGFTGDYGVLTIQDGKLAPFNLYNINDIEYGYKNNGYIYGRRPPDAYAWWPFANWGLRDSNLSADFPTTAKINIDLYKQAGQGDVDGLIQVTPVAISHVLLVTGPIAVPDYGETITADNLEAKIRYYQQDPAGIAKQQQLNPNDATHSLRKRFTQLLGQLMEQKVRQLSRDQLLQVAKGMLADLRARDIQIYATNPDVEALLAKAHLSGAIDTTPGTDGYMLVQANVSVAKSTPYVTITQTDDVTLDDQGGATHRLVIQMKNEPGVLPVYGYTTYRDYLRVYVPQGAQLQGGSGFDTGVPLCWAPLQWAPQPKPGRFADVPDCPARPFPQGELSCPPGLYGPGPQAPTVFGADGGTQWALDRVGPPPATQSDVAGRAMFGGWVVIPDHCTATVRVSWHVPGVVRG